MSIHIRKQYKKKTDRDNEMRKYHDALVGSPAYINNEIAICEDGDTCFVLIVGYDNDCNLFVENICDDTLL